MGRISFAVEAADEMNQVLKEVEEVLAKHNKTLYRSEIALSPSFRNTYKGGKPGKICLMNAKITIASLFPQEPATAHSDIPEKPAS